MLSRRVPLTTSAWRRSIFTSVAAGSRRSLAMPLAGTSAVDKPALDTREATKSSAISPKSNKEVPTREAMAAHYEKYLDHPEEQDHKNKTAVKARTLSGEAGRISF